LTGKWIGNDYLLIIKITVKDYNLNRGEKKLLELKPVIWSTMCKTNKTRLYFTRQYIYCIRGTVLI